MKVIADHRAGPPTGVAAYEKLLKAEVEAEERLKARREAADRAAEAEAEVGVSTTEAEGSDVVEGSRNGDVGLISTALLLERDRCVAIRIC
jgi:hypothetical protein